MSLFNKCIHQSSVANAVRHNY